MKSHLSKSIRTSNVFPWLNLARLQMIFHLIRQKKISYTSPIVFLSYFRNHIDIQRTFATLHSHWKLAHKKRCADKMATEKMLNDLLAFCPDFIVAFWHFVGLNFKPNVLCNGEECLPRSRSNVVGCVVLRTDKTEYVLCLQSCLQWKRMPSPMQCCWLCCGEDRQDWIHGNASERLGAKSW